MTINLLLDDVIEWASRGKLEEISTEKRLIGWTGSPSDYAFAVWINSIFNGLDKRMNLVCNTINQLMQVGIPEYNALYQYATDSVVTHAGKIYRSKQPSAGQVPAIEDDDPYWERIVGEDWVNTQLDTKVDSDSGVFTGTPTTPTPTLTSEPTQIANVEYVTQQLDLRIRGENIIDLSTKDSNRAYPILLAKDNKATDSVIWRETGYSGSQYGNMRLVIKGLGAGLGKQNNSYLEVTNYNDMSMSDVQNFVKKIQCRTSNTCIVVWLRGGTKYHIYQRNAETKFEVIDENTTLEDGWLVGMEEWVTNQYLKDGVWSFSGQTDALLDYTSISATGSIETVGTYCFSPIPEPCIGSLPCFGQEVSRTMYAKLFDKIGTRYGVGDGINTFNMPDARGKGFVCIDNGAGIDSNELVTAPYGGSADRTTLDGVGSIQTDAIRNITGSFKHANMSQPTGCFYATTLDGSGRGSGSYGWYNAFFDASRVVPTATKNQINNIAVLVCMYYV